MSSPSVYKEKYEKLRERYNIMLEERADLKKAIQYAEKKAKALKEENGHMVDLIIELQPSLLTSLSDDESDVALSNGPSSEDEETNLKLAPASTKRKYTKKTVSTGEPKASKTPTKSKRKVSEMEDAPPSVDPKKSCPEPSLMPPLPSIVAPKPALVEGLAASTSS